MGAEGRWGEGLGGQKGGKAAVRMLIIIIVILKITPTNKY